MITLAARRAALVLALRDVAEAAVPVVGEESAAQVIEVTRRIEAQAVEERADRLRLNRTATHREQ